ncbi:MAG: LCP family protein [Defluviitaleaceae bacterium]|nr:LCP family protein [Defluviitaleaceae bacterium]
MIYLLKDKKTRSLFKKSFFITLVSVFVIVGGSFVVLRSLIRPPTIPTDTALPFFNPNLDYTLHDPYRESAFDVVDPHPDDALIRSPFDFSADEGWERRPDFYTVLLFGYDEGLNTDTIMVAAFDAAARRGYLVSIPRDTQVDVRRSIRRINSAYPVGTRFERGGHAGGVAQLKREVQTIIGFRPDFYVSVEEDAFVRLVNAVGGVYVNVPFPMRYDDPTQDLHINIPAGHQRLDGENALHFARFRLANDPRHTISDMRRMEHQQQLIAALIDELMTPRTITRIPELIGTYRDHVNTDLSIFELLWFAEQFVLGEIELITYNYPTTSVRTSHWYEIPNAEEALEMINRTINPFTRELTMANLQLVN